MADGASPAEISEWDDLPELEDGSDDELDVGYKLLEYTFSDDEDPKDTAVYAGDVIVCMITNDSEFDLEDVRRA